MNDGEEAPQEPSGVASPDPLDRFRSKSDSGDASPTSSLHYSSCGESDFDRYCSANSMMGTPSMCSSTGAFNDCESEFGSLRSGFGFRDALDVENFSLGPSAKLSSVEKGSLVDHRIGLWKKGIVSNNDRINMPCETNSGSMSEDVDQSVSVRNENGQNENDLRDAGVGNDSADILAENEIQNDYPRSDLHSDGSQMERDEDENLSRYEHSDGDDSMYGSDGDQRKNSHYLTNVQCQKDQRAKNENPLAIESSVAFGSDDWDDFELEAGVGTESYLTLSMFEQKMQDIKIERIVSSSSAAILESSDIGQKVSNNQISIPLRSRNLQDADQINGKIDNISATEDDNHYISSGHSLQSEEVKDSKSVGTNELTSAADIRTMQFPQSYSYTSVSTNQIKGTPVWKNYSEISGNVDVSGMLQNVLEEKDPLRTLNTTNFSKQYHLEDEHENTATHDTHVGKDQELGSCSIQRDPSSNGLLEQLHPGPTEFADMLGSQYSGDYMKKLSQAPGKILEISSKDSLSATKVFEVDAYPAKTGNIEVNDFYDDFVHDMEEILLDSGNPHGERFTKGDKMSQPQSSLSQRGEGLTATTSGLDDSASRISQRVTIDAVEVVGAKQKKGEVSLSERLVGVKEYTVYVIRVWSGKDKWEVERRYRDFVLLHQRLKSLFTNQGRVLPTPWSSIERESRKVFGTSPNIISKRSDLIQECLRSIIEPRFFSSPPNALLQFLSPEDMHSSTPQSDSLGSQSRSFVGDIYAESLSAFGLTISLVVEIQPEKSTRQLLEAQHYACAGCHKYFDDRMTLLGDFVKILGYGKPRFCSYTGQLFCSSCHTNETSVLPARVLHQWDFSRYPVSQMARSYLDSIREQPMLCVSAVNPFLFSKVPALNHVMSVRRKIGNVLRYIRCPFRRTLNKGLGSRRYLLESNDFFALRDLIDLSKGAFSALPVNVETVLRKILEHITEQCLVCCDVGVACSARQACSDPSSLIFPFQEEDEVEKCPSCKSPFHKNCFEKLANCHCGTQLGEKRRTGGSSSNSFNGETSRESDMLMRRSTSTSVLPLRFFSRLLSSKSNKDSDTVILMGSMPSNDL